MNRSVSDAIIAYFEQQSELGIPDYIFTTPYTNEIKDYPLQDENSGEINQVSEPQDSPQGYEAKRAALVELYYEVKNCKGCQLSNTRTKLVFGAGNAGAPVMVIGEAPGRDEDLQGIPFVGKAGALLTKMLAAIQLDREKDVFITNVLKCRPPENRNPGQTESLACIPILRRQIAIIKPQAILALGRIAAHELLNVTEGIGKLRTETHNYNSTSVIVTYHPAALLRNERYKRPAWEDLQKLQIILRDKGIYGSSEK